MYNKIIHPEKYSNRRQGFLLLTYKIDVILGIDGHVSELYINMSLL